MYKKIIFVLLAFVFLCSCSDLDNNYIDYKKFEPIVQELIIEAQERQNLGVLFGSADENLLFVESKKVLLPSFLPVNEFEEIIQQIEDDVLLELINGLYKLNKDQDRYIIEDKKLSIVQLESITNCFYYFSKEMGSYKKYGKIELANLTNPLLFYNTEYSAFTKRAQRIIQDEVLVDNENEIISKFSIQKILVLGELIIPIPFSKFSVVGIKKIVTKRNQDYICLYAFKY